MRRSREDQKWRDSGLQLGESKIGGIGGTNNQLVDFLHARPD